VARHGVRPATFLAQPHPSPAVLRVNVFSVPVIEILSESSYRMHELTPFAQVKGLQITYPPEQAMLL
jgi:hypothetical protein